MGWKACKIGKVRKIFRQKEILQYQVGGMVAFVEAENKEKLLAFYENYGFKRFDTRQTVLGDAESHELVQLLKLI